mmetsp:Transcript_39679/g.71200  ORF Transcript_39679/g.71200 Transcript_39679/m.71200 type:complete len:248 (-) Transcript_39679:373-1116(-)
MEAAMNLDDLPVAFTRTSSSFSGMSPSQMDFITRSSILATSSIMSFDSSPCCSSTDNMLIELRSNAPPSAFFSSFAFFLSATSCALAAFSAMARKSFTSSCSAASIFFPWFIASTSAAKPPALASIAVLASASALTRLLSKDTALFCSSSTRSCSVSSSRTACRKSFCLSASCMSSPLMMSRVSATFALAPSSASLVAESASFPPASASLTRAITSASTAILARSDSVSCAISSCTLATSCPMASRR